jgi:Holliday junction resolvase-like predicted endonuclease
VSANISKDSKHQQGFNSENIVIAHFERQGFVVKTRRWRTPFAEVDLLLFHEMHGWCIVEVKSKKGLFIDDLLSQFQLQRLRRAVEFVSHRVGQTPRLLLAAVNNSGQVEIIPLE